MGERAIDVLTLGPCPEDPYDPAALPWSLAGGLAAAGHHVRVLHPPGASPGPSPPGVASVPLPITFRRPGAALEAADLAHAADRHIRPDADLVVRDPFGMGRLRFPHHPEPPEVLGVVRRVEAVAFDVSRAEGPTRLLDRVDAWRDRRAVRRLERAALEGAARLVYDDPALPALLEREYGIAGGRLRPLPPPVGLPTSLPTREAARKELRLPLDVPVIVAPLASADPRGSGAERIREAFRRVRSLFPGTRLVVVGAALPTEPGMTSLADRSLRAFTSGLTAGDVAVLAPEVVGFDPGAVLAMRLGCPVLAGPGVRLPLAPGGALWSSASNDPGDLAAALAEMLADPSQRHALIEAGSHFGERFEPSRVALEAVGTG